MDESNPAQPSTPPVTGVSPVQNAPTEVVSEIPTELKNAGGISQYPVTSMIDTFRRDANSIRGDGPLLMLRSLVEKIEYQALTQQSENREIRTKLDSAHSENRRLEVENAVLRKEVDHKDSDRNARTAFVAIGALGFGIFCPIAVSAPEPKCVFGAIAFAAMFGCGLFYPTSSKGKH